MIAACGFDHAGVSVAACKIRGVRAASVSGAERHVRRLAEVAEIEITGGVTSGTAATPPEGSAL